MESGWHGFTEVNRVVFDPQKVTVQQMVEWLKKTGTYIRTIKQTIPPDHVFEGKDDRSE